MSGQCPAWNGVIRTVSIRDKLFAILRYLIFLFILDGSGHIYLGFVLKWLIRIRAHITLYLAVSWTANNILFYLYWQTLHMNTQQVAWAPCIAALILSECTNSSYKATRTALSRTAPDITILISSPSPGVLALILSKWMNSLRNTAQTTLNEQLQTASKLLLQASRVGISLSILRVTGAAHIIRIISSLAH